MAYDILALATLVVLSLISSTKSLDIDVQPQFVRPYDKNVIFTCAGGNDTKRVSEKMFRMRLMKLGDNNQWTEVAALHFDGSIDMTDDNVTAIGRLGDVLQSYLVVTWSVAPDDINGLYRCDAITLTSTGDIVTEQSRDLDLKSLSTDLSLLLERLQKSERRLVGKVNQTIYGAMRSSKTNLFSILDSKFKDLKEYLDSKTAVSITRPEVNVEIMRWPAGNFTLLMPDAGCPTYPPAWSKSLLKMKAFPGDKYYPMDIPLHLANPHKKDGFIYRQFCTLPASPERTEPWPAGSYCLYEMDMYDRCPTGFKHVDARVKVPDDDSNLYVYYLPNNLQLSGYFGILSSEFCCRHDGDATTPIDLPVSHPFYLKRHRGRCQEVKGMDVTQDVFMMETVEDAGYDKWVDSYEDFRPDVSFKPYKEELCYYSRKTM